MPQVLPNNSKGSEASSDQSSQGTDSTPSILLPKGGNAIGGIGERFAANPKSFYRYRFKKQVSRTR